MGSESSDEIIYVNQLSIFLFISKTLLKLTIPRIKLLRNRRYMQLKQMRKEIAKLLEIGQEATARIRVSDGSLWELFYWYFRCFLCVDCGLAFGDLSLLCFYFYFTFKYR